MSFLTTENPVFIILTLIVLSFFIKAWISRQKSFSGSRSKFAVPAMILILLALVLFNPALKALGIALPYLIMVAVFLIFLAFALHVFGVPKNEIIPQMKNAGILKPTIKIATICILIFAVSTVVGQNLLEDKSVPITGNTMITDETPEIDFSPFFTKSALSLIIVFVVLGMLFLFVTEIF